MFDTHCHLNFKAFDGREEETINRAKQAGINSIVAPGTDIKSSTKAVELASRFEGVYAAVGIHPHHVFEHLDLGKSDLINHIQQIEDLVKKPKVVAIGEVGLDRHYYNKTKYPDYQIDSSFMELQIEFLRWQIDLAIKHKKSLIFHNREAKSEFLAVLADYRQELTGNRCVFHCCEPDQELLAFARQNQIFIGVDGDITYRKDKQEFIKTVPLDQLVLETDSPFLLPEPLRTQKKYPNQPANLKPIASFIAGVIGIEEAKLESITEENSKRLFSLS